MGLTLLVYSLPQLLKIFGCLLHAFAYFCPSAWGQETPSQQLYNLPSEITTRREITRHIEEQSRMALLTGLTMFFCDEYNVCAAAPRVPPCHHAHHRTVLVEQIPAGFRATKRVLFEPLC